MRNIDMKIKDTYWKIVEIEILKNKSVKQLIVKLNSDRKNTSDNLNSEIYKHLDIPVNKILNQDIYIKFQNNLDNVTKSIEEEHDLQQLKHDLMKHIKEYKLILQKYQKLEDGSDKPLNIVSIYVKYKETKVESQKIDNYIKEFDVKYNIIVEELNKYKKELQTQENKRDNILNQIDKYKINNLKIIESKIDVKLNRFITKTNIRRRKEINKINNYITDYTTEKIRLLNEIDNIEL